MIRRQLAHHTRTRATNAAAWTLALLAFAGVVVLVVRRSELEELIRLVRGLRPALVVAALALQAATYVCAAGVPHRWPVWRDARIPLVAARDG